MHDVGPCTYIGTLTSSSDGVEERQGALRLIRRTRMSDHEDVVGDRHRVPVVRHAAHVVGHDAVDESRVDRPRTRPGSTRTPSRSARRRYRSTSSRARRRSTRRRAPGNAGEWIGTGPLARFVGVVDVGQAGSAFLLGDPQLSAVESGGQPHLAIGQHPGLGGTIKDRRKVGALDVRTAAGGTWRVLSSLNRRWSAGRRE